MLTMIISYNPAYISDQKAQIETNETGGTTHRDQILDTIVLYTKRWLALYVAWRHVYRIKWEGMSLGAGLVLQHKGRVNKAKVVGRKGVCSNNVRRTR